MKMNRWIILTLASLMLVSCAEEAANNLVVETPVAITSSPSLQPTSTEPEATVVKSGSFASGEQPTEGTARILTRDNQTFLEFDQGFKTSNMGPDLVVVLHRSSDVLGSTKPPAYPLKEEEYVLLAPLQKVDGAQQYAIPATINLTDYNSAVIWCRKFNATFGAAALVSQ